MTRPRALSFRVPEDVNEWPFCRGVAFGIVGGLLLWAAIGAAVWSLWGRP